MAQTVKQQIERLSKLIGRSELVARLKITDLVLESWVSGNVPIRERHLLTLAELALEHDALGQDKSGDTYRATVIRAVKVLGGIEPVSKRLQNSTADLIRWLTGADTPSMGTFLKVIDILLEENRNPTGRLQMRADRSQAKADRSQAQADRDQARADRDQEHADRREADEGNTSQPSRPLTEHFRQVRRENSEPASNAPDHNESGKATG